MELQDAPALTRIDPASWAIGQARDGNFDSFSASGRPQARRLRRPGRVGTGDYSPVPLTEPYVRVTHTAPWIGMSEFQRELVRDLRRGLGGRQGCYAEP